MTFGSQPAETDLLLPLPPRGERWDPHLIHTHYFGFSVPEAQIGAFVYVRYQPAFPLSQGGVCIREIKHEASDCEWRVITGQGGRHQSR